MTDLSAKVTLLEGGGLRLSASCYEVKHSASASQFSKLHLDWCIFYCRTTTTVCCTSVNSVLLRVVAVSLYLSLVGYRLGVFSL